MPTLIRRRHVPAALAGLAGLVAGGQRPAHAASPTLPLFDAHLHYSHDAWDLVPPAQAVDILRQAGLRGALVSSSNDEGTQRLVQIAPELVVAELRPYRLRSDISTWVRDATVPAYLEQRLARYRYVGIGEFHVYGEDADLPVPRALVGLARQAGLLLHAHSDAEAVGRLFKQWPQARILWAHAGFDRPEAVREMLRRHPQLWCDLAFRSDQATGAEVAPAWREAFAEFPERFMVGTDTFTPERWHYIGPHAAYSREWLAALPAPVAERIGWRNAEALLRPATPRNG
jgi:predicted TIM-barrel fold metal-dependent hydrolase